jgi:hypothetical protein
MTQTDKCVNTENCDTYIKEVYRKANAQDTSCVQWTKNMQLSSDAV